MKETSKMNHGRVLCVAQSKGSVIIYVGGGGVRGEFFSFSVKEKT